MAIATSGIDHVHLSVTDIEAFIARFSSILDCESKIPLYIDSIQALNSMNSLNLDVFEPKEREGIAARQMAGFGGPGLTTLSMLVEDIDAATAHIESCGVRVISKIGYPGVEIQSQFHPKDCFGMVLELIEYIDGHEQVIAEINAKQALDNRGRTFIPAQAGALAGSGIDHAHLRVPDLDDARRWLSRLFVCDWEDVTDTIDGAPTCRSSIGIHLNEAHDERPGLSSLAFGVDDMDAASALADAQKLRRLPAAGHRQDETCLVLDRRDVFDLSLELVPSR